MTSNPSRPKTNVGAVVSSNAKKKTKTQIQINRDDHPASRAARELVQEHIVGNQWTWKEETTYRIRIMAMPRSRKYKRRLRIERATRKTGFAPYQHAISLDYNRIHPSSLDATSYQQRSDVDNHGSEYDDGREDLADLIKTIVTAEEAASSSSAPSPSTTPSPSLANHEILKKYKNKLDIFPVILWSMGKSFHEGIRHARVIMKEARHAKLYPNGNRDLYNKLKQELKDKVPENYGLVAWSLPLPFLLGTQSGCWRQNKFLALSYFLGCPLVDRTGIFNDDLGIKLINRYPIPKFNPRHSCRLPDIMLERARQAIRRSKDRKNDEIWILWSGGIDTTAVVCAFLQVTANDPDDRRRLVVRYQPRSIDEYPAFFRNVISKELRHRMIDGHVRDVFNITPSSKNEEDNVDEAGIPLVVTGDPADMLFGTFRMAGAFEGSDGVTPSKVFNPEGYSLSERWQHRAPKLLHERCLLLNSYEYHDWQGNRKEVPCSSQLYKDAAAAWVEWMSRQVIKAPIPIITMFDFWWWITYSCKYNHDVMRTYYNRADIPQRLRRRVFNFYQAYDFHQYSFKFHHTKIQNKKVWASYKQPLKKFILDYCQSQNLAPPESQFLWKKGIVPDDHTVYYQTKVKVQSVANSWGMEVGIDTNWNVIKFGACSISQKALTLDFADNEDGWSLLHKLFLTQQGKWKVEGDLRLIKGEYREAYDYYIRAHVGSWDFFRATNSLIDTKRRDFKVPPTNKRSTTTLGTTTTTTIDCTDEIKLCRSLHWNKKKDNTKKASSDHLMKQKVRAVASTSSWRERKINEAYIFDGGAYIFDGGGGWE